MKNRLILIIALTVLVTGQVLQAAAKKQASSSSQASEFTQSQRNYMNYAAAGINSSAQ